MKTNLQIVADHYAASACQDLTGMMAEVSPDVDWTEMAGFPCAGTWIGPNQVIAKVFDVLGTEWETTASHWRSWSMVASTLSAWAPTPGVTERPARRCRHA